jgi:hypothetical protein
MTRPGRTDGLRPRVEELETRVLPSTFTVNTTNNAGAGSLRAGINAVNNGTDDTIEFNLLTSDPGYNPSTGGWTITLGSDLPIIVNNVTITGPGPDFLTISGDNHYTAFDIDGANNPNSITAKITGLSIIDCNAGSGGIGGAIGNGGYLTVNNCVFSGNVAGSGGAIYNSGPEFSTPGTSLTLNHDTFSNNRADGSATNDVGYGGAIDNLAGVVDTSLPYSFPVIINTCVFTGNTAEYGGAVSNTIGQMTISDSTFEGNQATGRSDSSGGAITNNFDSVEFSTSQPSQFGNNLTIEDCTISGNTATGSTSTAGGIWSDDLSEEGSQKLSLINTILAGNTAGSDPDIHYTTENQLHDSISASYCLIGNRTGAGTGNLPATPPGGTDSNHNQIGTGTAPLDPQLASLGYYGGPTETMALLSGSPAIGMGEQVDGTTTDQRGFPLDTPEPDIGAFQTQTNPFVVTTGADSSPGNSAAGKLSLRDAIGLVDALNPAGVPSIIFHIPTSDASYNAATGVFTIQAAARMPTISAAVTLDATSEAPFLNQTYTTPLIDLSGTSAGNSDGLDVKAGNTTITGLAINNFSGNGIHLLGSGPGDDAVYGNYIGTDVSGVHGMGNGASGILVESANNTIGGVGSQFANVISANDYDGITLSGSGATGNIIQGNDIGTNAGGSAALTSTAYAFNGGSVTLPVAEVSTASGAATTVSFWMDWNGSFNGSNGEIPLSFGGSPGYDLWLDPADNGSYGFNVGNSDLYGISSSSLANTWTFVTAVFVNGAESNDLLYIDGVEQTPTMRQGSAQTGSASTTAYLGTYQTSNAYDFSGDLSQVAFFNGALTQNQINTEYHAGAAATYSGIVLDQGTVAYYPLTENTGSVAGDQSGQLNHGAISSTGVIPALAAGPLGGGNGEWGIEVFNGSSNTIGGTSAGAGNVISGNAQGGVAIYGSVASGNVVQGNLVGLTSTNAALGNAYVSNAYSGINVGAGIFVGAAADLGYSFVPDNGTATNTTIGGTTPQAYNTISANDAELDPGGGLWLANGTTGDLIEGNNIGTDATGTALRDNYVDAIDIDSGTAQSTGGTLTVDGAVIGGGALTLANGGTLDASSASNASLSIGLSTFTLNGTVNLNGSPVVIGAIAGSGTVTNSGGAATLTLNGGGTFGGSISGGNITLNVPGSGQTLTLTGANSPGSTMVSAGTLDVDGSLSSVVGVANSATLGGGQGAVAGMIGGPVTVTSGGNLTPGDTSHPTGILDTGALTLDSGSTYNVALVNTTTGSAGSGYDLVQVAGPATLNGGTLNILSTSFTSAVGDTIPILTATAVSGTFGNAGGVVTAPNGMLFQIGYTNTSVTLTHIASITTVSSVTVGSQTGSVTYGTGGSVTYSVTVATTTRGNSPPNVTLTVSGLPAGVSGYFSPNSLGSAGGAATLTLTTTSAALVETNYSFIVSATATNTVSQSGFLTLNRLVVTLAGSRTYNGTTTASFSTLSITNVVDSDNVSLASGSATLSSKDVGSPSISSNTLTLTGTAASNYTTTGATGTVTISPKALTYSGLSVPASKVYDDTAAATVSGTAALQAPEAAGTGSTSDGIPYTIDTVNLTGIPTASYNSKEVATANMVTFAGLALTGAQAGDYTLTASTQVATITAKTLFVSGLSTRDKTYDATMAATLTGTAALLSPVDSPGAATSDGTPYAGDSVTLGGTSVGAFVSKDVGNSISVTVSGNTLSGAQASDYVLAANEQSGLTATIIPFTLTVTGITATGRPYDNDTDAMIDTTDAAANFFSGDATTLVTSGAGGTFDTKDVGTGKTVTISGLSLANNGPGDYQLASPQATTTADVATKTLYVSGLSANNKTYDATTAATLTGTAKLLPDDAAGASTTDGHPYTGDAVSLTATAASAFLGSFLSKDAATGIVVQVTGDSLTGAQSGDYVLSSTDEENGAVTANISPKVLTYSGLSVPANKVYDGTAAATVSGTAALQAPEAAGTGSPSDGIPYTGDTVSLTGTPTASYNSKEVATAKTVTFAGLALTGAQAGDYTLTASSQTATITAKTLTVTGITANNKPYDGTPTATAQLNLGSAGLDGVIPPDSVSLITTGAIGTFNSPDVNTATTVTVSGLSLSGAQASDYQLSTPQDTTPASIIAATLTYTANAASRAYGAANPPFSGTVTGFVDGQNQGSATTGTLTFTTTATAASPVGSYPINGSGLTANNGDYTFVQAASNATALTVYAATVTGSIYVLDPAANGAVNISGNASVNAPGAVVVDSSSASAVLASGNASLNATGGLYVAGGVNKSGNASVQTALHSVPMGDPLASLPLPALPTGAAYNTAVAENLGGNSTATISQGYYSTMNVSGNANLMLNPGVYVIGTGGVTVSGNAVLKATGVTFLIKGGGFTVSGSAGVSGTNVFLFSGGSGYNGSTDGGSYGSINLSGNSTFSLSANTSGTYAGILIFQDRSNPQALAFTGNAVAGITGTVYPKDAALTVSGNGSLPQGNLVVDTLNLSGKAEANTLGAPPAGTVAYTPAQIRTAYGINGLTLDGTGQTIAIVDAYDDPSLYQAVDAFDNQFGLTASGPTLFDQYGAASTFLTVLNQNGQTTAPPVTDPSGAGTDNWEVEEALDVEWAHAIAPGAQIILVEASSQALSALMASVAIAASRPGVAVVNMSWGFPEGQSVFQNEEATYDGYFTTPGVTFVASTGDYGTADPEYPAFSPNVLAVGGTSLNLNGDGSYIGEAGWGYQSAAAGAFIGSGGGLSLYEPEPAYQQGVQSTGSRTTPDVSFVADPNTGAWIADPYNLDPSNPFEVVGGTSLSAPAWTGLIALADQGRAAAGELPLDSPSSADAQQALYSLPQVDYNVISSGYNGYTAGPGYNLVSGLGTPVVNSLIADLIAWNGTASYAGPTVHPLQSAYLVNTGGGGANGPTNAINVFSALTLPSLPGADSVPAVARSTSAAPMAGPEASLRNLVAAPAVTFPARSAAPTAVPPGAAADLTVAAWSAPSNACNAPTGAALPIVSVSVGSRSGTAGDSPGRNASDGFLSDGLDRFFQDNALLPEDDEFLLPCSSGNHAALEAVMAELAELSSSPGKQTVGSASDLLPENRLRGSELAGEALFGFLAVGLWFNGTVVESRDERRAAKQGPSSPRTRR